MSEPAVNASADRAIEQNLRSLRHLVNTNLDDIERRNEALLFRCPLAPVSCKLNTAVSNVKVSTLYRSRFGKGTNKAIAAELDIE